MGVGGHRYASAALPPEKTRYPLIRRLGGPQSRSGWLWKHTPPNGIRSPDRPARSESFVIQTGEPQPPGTLRACPGL